MLGETEEPEVRRLADAIFASQGAEISTMEEMLRDRGGDAPDGGDGMEGMDHGG